MKIKTIDENMQMMVIASVAFEANRQYCEMIGGKAYNPAWTEVGQDVRDALIESVKVALTDKIVSAELSHLRWAAVRVEAGWSIGPRFDPYRKTDPNLVPFRELSVQEQLKDILFLAIVNSLGAALGYREFDDDPLAPEVIQEHQETIAGLETAVTGKTDFVPGEGKDDKRKDEDDDKPEAPEGERENEKPEVDTIDEITTPGSKDAAELGLPVPPIPAGQGPEFTPPLPGEEGDDTKLAVAPEAVEPARPDELADEVSEPAPEVPGGVPVGETRGPKPNLPADEVPEPPPDRPKPDELAPNGQNSEGSVSEPKPPPPPDKQNPEGSVSEPTQPPAPPDDDPVDHKATQAKKPKKK